MLFNIRTGFFPLAGLSTRRSPTHRKRHHHVTRDDRVTSRIYLFIYPCCSEPSAGEIPCEQEIGRVGKTRREMSGRLFTGTVVQKFTVGTGASWGKKKKFHVIPCVVVFWIKHHFLFFSFYTVKYLSPSLSLSTGWLCAYRSLAWCCSFVFS